MKIPGVYVEIKGDMAQLKNDMKQARQYVTEQSRDMSNAINNALSDQQVKGRVNSLVANLGTLSRASKAAGSAFDSLGVDLKEMQRVTGVTDKQFASLQSRMLKTQSEKAQERALRSIASAAGLTQKEIKQLGKQFGLTKTQIDKLNKTTKSTSSNFISMGTAIKGALAYFSVTSLTHFGGELIKVADNYSLVDSKLKLVTGSTEEFNAVYDRLFDISQNTGSSFVDNANSFSGLSMAVKDTGISSKELLQIFEDLNKSLVVAGATTQETQSFMLQFKQALGANRLAGDEFKAMLEANSYWAGKFAEALGTDIGGLYEMKEAGELTTKVVFDAHKKMTAGIDADWSKINKTVARSMQELRNAFEQIIRDTNNTVDGTSSISKSISELATTITNNKEEISGAFVGLINGAESAVEVIANIARSFAGWEAVGEGRLSFFEFATMNAQELSDWLAKDKAGIIDLQKQLDTVRNKISDTQDTWGLWKDKKGTLATLRAEEQQLIEAIDKRQNAAIAAAAAEVNSVETSTKAVTSALNEQEEGSKSLEKVSLSIGDAWLENAKRSNEAFADIKRNTDLQIALLNSLDDAHNTATDSWLQKERLKVDASENTNKELDTFTKEFVSFSNAATADIVTAFVQGEDTKVAVAGLASRQLTQYAVDSATKGLEPIFEALGAQIGSWIGLGAAEESTEGVGWQEKLANAAKYLAGAGAAVFAGKAIGDSFHASGGWLGANKSGGMITGGSGVKDDVFLGFTDDGNTRNWGMAKEYVINQASTQKYLPIIEAINSDTLFADGGAITDAWKPTRDINDSGFDAFWDSVVSSNGNWKAAIAQSIAYYAGTGAGMLAGKAIGPAVMGYSKGGPIRDRGFGFGGWFSDILDPGGYFHEVENTDFVDLWSSIDQGSGIIFGAGNSYQDQLVEWLTGETAGKLGLNQNSIDWGTIWAAARNLPVIGDTIARADKILYPFVNDTLTPGVWPDWDTAENMLKGTYSGLADEVGSWIKDAAVGQLSDLIKGQLHDGGVVPSDGTYFLKGGERVTPESTDKEILVTLKRIVAALESNSKSSVNVQIGQKALRSEIDYVVVQREKQGVRGRAFV